MSVMRVAMASCAAGLLALAPHVGARAADDFDGSLRVSVDFSRKVVDWDGFGVNYVEVPQTRDYAASPQEYGGLSTLTDAQREEIFEAVFGDDGLRPGLVKMFLDPWHEPVNDNADPHATDASRFDHETTTKWMRLFVRRGLQKTRARGDDLQIITTLYGPPAWTTEQGYIRGRDLNPAMKYEVAEYIIAWAKYLKTVEQFPVTYVGLHNEGEDFNRWPVDGKGPGHERHDYNMFWPAHQVVDFLRFMRPMLDKQGLTDVGIAPGEPTNWYRFVMWGYAPAIAADPEALRNLGVITSHGFTGTDEWFGDHRGEGVELLRLKRPELRAWTTSMTWGRMDPNFIADIWGQIYRVKVNGVIPWAAVQTDKWVGGDPNPGTAIRVMPDCGCYALMNGYYFYKQVTRAGQPGMYAAATTSADTVRVLAFASNGTRHPDAFVIVNPSWNTRTVRVRLAGTQATRFTAYRTSGAEKYAAAGEVQATGGEVVYEAPGASVTTFFALR
jgi:O-glycosyl hydrolase